MAPNRMTNDPSQDVPIFLRSKSVRAHHDDGAVAFFRETVGLVLVSTVSRYPYAYGSNSNVVLRRCHRRSCPRD